MYFTIHRPSGRDVISITKNKGSNTKKMKPKHDRKKENQQCFKWTQKENRTRSIFGWYLNLFSWVNFNILFSSPVFLYLLKLDVNNFWMCVQSCVQLGRQLVKNWTILDSSKPFYKTENRRHRMPFANKHGETIQQQQRRRFVFHSFFAYFIRIWHPIYVHMCKIHVNS